jgi:hypothetical protein
MFGSAGVNKLSRFSRLGKIYKLVRIAKLTRLIRFMKVQSKLIKNLAEILKIGAGFERIVYLLITFFVL